jgi:hypothetical protein
MFFGDIERHFQIFDNFVLHVNQQNYILFIEMDSL